MRDDPSSADGSGSEASTLTAAVLSPWWALAYAGGVLIFNVALQAGARSEAVLAPLRSLVASVAHGTSAQALAIAMLSASMTVASYALMLLPAIALAVVARRRGVRFTQAVGLRAFPVGLSLGLSLWVVVGGLVGTAVYAAISGAIGVAVQSNTAQLVTAFGAGPLEIAIVFVLAGVVAPLVEEITFRGIIFPSMKAAWGTAPAMLISGGIFGMVHMQPTIAVPLALIGMALAAVFVRTRSLWSAILAHCMFNTVSLAFAFVIAAQSR